MITFLSHNHEALCLGMYRMFPRSHKAPTLVTIIALSMIIKIIPANVIYYIISHLVYRKK